MTLSPRAARLGGRVALVLAGAFAVALIASATADVEFGYDLDAYLGAADRLVAGEQLYPAVDPDGITPVGAGAYFYPPLVAAAFVPLAQLPIAAARLLWFAALIVLAGAVGVALVHSLGPHHRELAAAAYLAYLPLLSELRFGNVNMVTLALCLLAWNRRDRPAIAGALLAAAIGLKLLPLALVVFLVAGGRWRIAAWAGTIALAAVAASWPWLGGAWLDYVRVLGAIGTGAPAAGSNIVPDLLAHPPLRYLLPAVALGVAALAGWTARRRPSAETPAFRTALAAAPLLATTVWYPYLVLALPAILARGEGETRPGAATRAASWLAIEARLAPLPLLGLAAVVARGLLGLRDEPPEGRE
jgi:hypothetical protein